MDVIVPLGKNFNSGRRDAENEALRKKFLQLGRLIHQCGERPTAELFAECVTLPSEVRPYLISLDGGGG